MADLLFFKGFLQQFVLHAEFGEHLLQPPVLLLDRLRLGNHPSPWSLGPVALPWLDIHPAILRPPFVKRRIAHAMFTAKLRNWHAALGLAQDRKDLGLAVSRHLHLNLLMHLAEKTLLPQPLTFGGNYRHTSADPGQLLADQHVDNSVAAKQGTHGDHAAVRGDRPTDDRCANACRCGSHCRQRCLRLRLGHEQN